MIDEQGYKFFYHDHNVEPVNQNRHPLKTDEAVGLLRTNEENFSLKKRELGVMIKGFSVLQLRHLT